MDSPIQLLVGLGNPGAQYADTRHNVGAWFIEQLAEQHSIHLHFENKFHGLVGQISLQNSIFWLLIPTTFMNESGQSVSAMTKFYKIPATAILVIHDDLDFPPGVIRIKKGGGHGGHNGLRSIVDHLHSNEFLRMRIGIGRPRNRQDMVDYVLSNPSRNDQQQILTAIANGLAALPDLLKGDLDKATRELHAS